MAGLDVPNNEGYNNQRKEYLYNQIVKYKPELANTPDLLYGDLELIYIRMRNSGELPDALAISVPNVTNYLDSVKLLCSFPVRENGETSWPQTISINKAADEIYVSNQNATELRIDVRSLSSGKRKSSRIIITEDLCWSEGIPWFYNANGELNFVIRTKGGTPAQSAFYSLYNYTTNVVGAAIAIKGGVKADVEGDFFVTSDVWTRSVTNFYIYDWASVKAGAPTLLATIPVEGGKATAAKNQGLVYLGGNFILLEGDQTESPTYMIWDSNGKLLRATQFSKPAFKNLVNKLLPNTLTIDNYIYESEGGCNLDGKLVSAQIVNNNPAVTAEGVCLILQHNNIDGTRGVMQPVNTYVYDTGWVPLTLINGFTAAYGPTPAVRRIGNKVELRGHVIKNAITNYEACATLLSDFWPTKTETFGQTANTTTLFNARIADTTGNIELWSSAASAAWRSLSGMNWRQD